MTSIHIRRLVRRLPSRALILVGVALTPAPSAAQEPVVNPHGFLPEGLTCTDCHTTTSWTELLPDFAFDHAEMTDFPLDGRHAYTNCAGCHAGLVFDRIDTSVEDCATCHVDVHQGSSTRPCSACHGTDSFTSLDFGVVHPADFPLEGAHLQTSCESCHTNDLGGAFRPLDRECATCHMDDYVSSTVVDHERLGFSTDCSSCHSALDFRDVVFDHFEISGGFELVDAHAGIECTACHTGADGSAPPAPGGPTDCLACHRQDYDREHGGTGFPTDCAACHNGFDWDGAEFDHAFSIFSGPHREEWSDCADCHETPGDFETYSCFACHNRREMDDKHHEEPDYQYDSPTCVFCHPTGRS